MGRIATFAFAATCAALSASAGGAASDGTGSSDPTPELRADMRESCAASTRALAAAAMPAPVSELTIAVESGDVGWVLGHPGLSRGSVQPARAADMPVPQLVPARSAFIRGPDGTIDEFSLRATFDAIRLLRGCSDL
jgi:hypothetical protein